jgi:hypothetical protein
VKQLDSIFERLLAGEFILYFLTISLDAYDCGIGNKFTPTATNILLMGVIILLIALMLEGAEKPKRVQVIDKSKKSE